MSSPIFGIRRAECLAELNACIVEAETSTSAKAVTTMILTATGFDTSEVLQGLWADMDALATLRDVRRSFLV
ncbi:hypothetical protein [Methylobacterium hispanicum]|nr:hypothetical protein [Methylobacterium hispanicum]